MTRRRPTHERSQALHRILAILRNGDRTARELSDRGHVAITTLTKGGYIRSLMEDGLVHICRWNRPETSGAWAPVYRYGAGDNEPRPAATSNTVRAQAYRVRRGNDLARVRRQAKKLTPYMRTLAGMLGVQA